ncbi:MAG: zinc ribbon domain-containing protein [Planctomycetota bacterium]|nr:MAG: zinc ribbon domain-containing protein [Planctomycetota bacterium]
MPIYEYRCPKCNQLFEALQKMDAKEEDTSCPHCGHKGVKKVFSTFSSPAKGDSSSFSSSSFPQGGG